MKFKPLKRSQLPTLKVGEKLIDRDGDEYTFEQYDKSGSPVGALDETEDFGWYKLSDLSLKEQGVKSMESLKQYLEKHRDVFFTLGIVLVLDHFIFEGAFREKLKNIIESLLDKKAKALTDGK